MVVLYMAPVEKNDALQPGRLRRAWILGVGPIR